MTKPFQQHYLLVLISINCAHGVPFILQALHLIEEMDSNDDKKLSEAEILKNQDLFLNSEATDYGRQLHDERFYHEEL